MNGKSKRHRWNESMPTIQTFLRSCSPSSNWSSSFWHEIYLNMNTRQAVYSLQDCWAHDLLGFCLALAFPMYVRQDIFPIFSCCLYNPHNRPDLPAYPSCLTATHYKDPFTPCRNFYKVISFDEYITTSWGPGKHSMSPPGCRPPFFKPEWPKESKNGFKPIVYRSPL